MPPQSGPRTRSAAPAAALFLAVALALFAGATTALADETAAAAPAARTILAPGDLKLADHAGKVVLLDFWASWCKPCRMSMPWLSAMQRKYGAQGLQIVAISVDAEQKAMRSRLGDIDDGIIVVFDPEGELARQYQLKAMPTTFLIGRDGKPVGSHVGFHEKELPSREAEIVELLEVKP